MPRRYKRSLLKNRWSDQQLLAAKTAVTSKRMSRRAAAKEFGIPLTTLCDHLRGKSTKRYGGGPTILTKSEEHEIVVACQTLQQFGFPMTRDIVGKIVSDYLKTTARPHRFRYGTPGPDWWRGFLRRWPTLTQRKPEHLPRNRAQGTRPEVRLVTTFQKWCEQ